jgi:hypothetical protein
MAHNTACTRQVGMPSAHALGLGDARLKLTRPICLSSSFPRLSILPLGRDSPVRPSVDNAHRSTALLYFFL